MVVSPKKQRGESFDGSLSDEVFLLLIGVSFFCFLFFLGKEAREGRREVKLAGSGFDAEGCRSADEEIACPFDGDVDDADKS